MYPTVGNPLILFAGLSDPLATATRVRHLGPTFAANNADGRGIPLAGSYRVMTEFGFPYAIRMNRRTIARLTIVPFATCPDMGCDYPAQISHSVLLLVCEHICLGGRGLRTRYCWGYLRRCRAALSLNLRLDSSLEALAIPLLGNWSGRGFSR